MSIPFAFFAKDLRVEMSYRFAFVLQLLSAFPVVLMFFFLARIMDQSSNGPLAAYGGAYFPFALIGVAVQNYLSTSLTSYSNSIRDAQLIGTLEAMLVTPVGLPTFLFSSALYSFTFNALRIFFYLAIGSLLFNAGYHWGQASAVLAATLLTITSCSSLGLASAGFVMLFKRGDPINMAVNVVSWLLGGVYYPVSILPESLQAIAMWVPMTSSLEIMRNVLINGATLADCQFQVLVLTAWTALGLPAGYTFFRFALSKTKDNGTLGQY